MRDRDWIWLTIVAWGTGLAALWCDHLQLPESVAVEVRTLFGIFTCGAISVVLLDKARRAESVSKLELYQWTRLVSRWVYILMYSLALARMLFYLGETYQHEPGPVRPLDDFQFYIACCIIPLWVVRAVILTVPDLDVEPATENSRRAA